MILLLDAEQVILSKKATVPFLQNMEIFKSHTSAKATGDTAANDGEEVETNTLINGEGPENINKIPETILSLGNNINEVLILTPWGENLDHTPCAKLRNFLGSSKSLN